jgi:hypothetical protein
VIFRIALQSEIIDRCESVDPIVDNAEAGDTRPLASARPYLNGVPPKAKKFSDDFDPGHQ